MAMPLPEAAVSLSVVIPTHNRRELVLRAVDSVLAQDAGAALQIIVVDDGSTDGTGATLKRRYAQEPRVELLGSARRHASAARNLGFAAARGTFVCFLDSDDYWLPDTLAQILAVFAQDPALAFVSVDGCALATARQPPLDHIVAGDSPGWSHPRFGAAPLRSRRFPLRHAGHADAGAMLLQGDFFPAIVFGDLFYLSGMVMRRTCVEQAGPFNERFRYYNDWEFFARLCLQGNGAYLDYDGFRRDTGRADQISRRRPPVALARRHLFILQSLLRRVQTRPYRGLLNDALDHARYHMAHCLLATRHSAWARRYLRRCLQRGYRPLRCALLLAGMRWSR